MKLYNLYFLMMVMLSLSCKDNNQKAGLLSGDENHPNQIPLEYIHNFEINSSIRALEVENDSTCWFAGSNNKIGFTSDYGKNWKTITIAYDTLKLEFRSMAITGESVFVLSIGNPGLLFKINKQSLNYRLVHREDGEKVFYDAMKFWDDQRGIVIGDPTSDCMSVLKTVDGGDTWQKLKCNIIPAALEGEAAFAASNTNISLADQKAFVVTGGKAANVLIGDGYGTTWRKVNTPVQQGGQMTGIFTSHFLDSKTGVIAGGDWEDKTNTEKAMAITKDGGNTWKIVEDNPGYISCIQYRPSSQEIWACSTEGIFYSHSSGESWEKVNDQGYYSFRFSDSGNYLYFSKNNALMSTTVSTLQNK